MHAERTALPHQAVQQQGDFLGDLVVLDEELLELVDDQQDPRHRDFGPGLAEAVQVLAAGSRKSSPRSFSSASSRCSTLKPNSRSLSTAMTRGVGQLHRGVDLELDALLEVDQVQLDLVGAVAQGHVGDQGVQQGRLAGAGLAGDQTCCEVPLPSCRCCSLVAPARPSGTSMPLRLSSVQYSSGLGAMKSNGTSTRLASRAALPTSCSSSENRARSGGASSDSGIPAEIRLAPLQPALLPDHVDAGVLELLELEARGQPELGIEQHQRVDAAARRC